MYLVIGCQTYQLNVDLVKAKRQWTKRVPQWYLPKERKFSVYKVSLSCWVDEMGRIYDANKKPELIGSDLTSIKGLL